MSTEHNKLPYTLFDLNETIGNAKRYSLVNHGPVAYLSTSEECAQYIVKACNAYDTLVNTLGEMLHALETPGDFTDEELHNVIGDAAYVLERLQGDK